MFQRLLTAVAVAAALALPSAALAAEWTKFSVPEVGLTFEMPGKAERKVSEPEEGDAVGDIAYVVEFDGAAYIVQVSQSSIDLGDPAAGAEIGVQVMKRNVPNAAIVSDDTSRQGRVFIRRTVVRAGDDGMAAQISMLDTRLLVAVVYLQPNGKALAPEAVRFLDSIKISRP